MFDLIDTHQHLLYRKHLGYEWSDSLPALAGQDFTLSDYDELTRDKGVAGTIFMEVDADDYRREAHFIAELAKDPDNRILGLIASCRPEESDGFEAWLDECTHLPVVGFRRILHEAPDELSQTQQFRQNVALMGARGWTFDLCVRADQLAIGTELARSCSDMNIVLDHCGVPDIAGGAFEHWQKGIREIAECENVTCKISGVLAYCAEGSADLETIKPYVMHIIESFGPNRLLWGSDWPVVNLKSALPDWIEIFRTLIAELSLAEQTVICAGNARRIYLAS